MYLEHFGLREEPFALTTDPRFLFLSPAHAQGQACLEFAVLKSDGIVVITGAIGAGKSTLAHDLATRAANEVVVVHNTHVGALGLLQEIFTELVHDNTPDTKAELLIALRQEFANRFQNGTRTVLVVDEAQHLDAETLEDLRMLADEQVFNEKPMSIVLVGQPCLADTLQGPALEQVRQRIRLHFHLPPLNLDDTERYLAHRLCIASNGASNPALGHCDPAQLFDRDAVIVIHRYTGGVPRLINVLADLALMTAWMDEARVVTAPMIKGPVKDLGWVPYRRRRDIDLREPTVVAPRLGVPAAVLGGLKTQIESARQRWVYYRSTLRVKTESGSAGTLGRSLPAKIGLLRTAISKRAAKTWSVARERFPRNATITGQAIHGRIEAVFTGDNSSRIVAGSAAAIAVVALLGAVAVPLQPDDNSAQAVADTKTIADPIVIAVAEPASATLASTTAKSILNSDAISATRNTADASSPKDHAIVALSNSSSIATEMPQPTAAATKEPVSRARGKTTAARDSTESAQAGQSAKSLPEKATVDPKTAATNSIKQTIRLPSASWLLEQSPESYAIQVFATHQPDSLNRFAETQKLDQMAYYHRRRDNEDWYVVLIGQFPSYEQATTASANLPAAVRRNKPWVRKMALVHNDIHNTGINLPGDIEN